MKKDRLHNRPSFICSATSMHRFLPVLLVIGLAGCVSAPQTRTPDASKYDNSQEARMVYVKAFADGWQNAWSGGTIEMLPRDMNQPFTNTGLKAADLDGFNDGVRAGSEDRRHLVQEYLDRTSK